MAKFLKYEILYDNLDENGNGFEIDRDEDEIRISYFGDYHYKNEVIIKIDLINKEVTE